jgi:hypothetical protein
MNYLQLQSGAQQSCQSALADTRLSVDCDQFRCSAAQCEHGPDWGRDAGHVLTPNVRGNLPAEAGLVSPD